MKKRLLGLTALLLCAVMVCAPVMAMAYTPSNWYGVGDEIYDIWGINDIIYADGNTSFNSYWQGNATHVAAVEYSTGEKFTLEQKMDGSGFTTTTHTILPLPSNEAWMITKWENTSDPNQAAQTIELTKVKELFRQKNTSESFGGEILIVGFENMDVILDKTGSAELFGNTQTVQAKFAEELDKVLPGYNGKQFFDATIYIADPDIPKNVLQFGTSFFHESFTFTLPYPAGCSYAASKPEDFALLHMTAFDNQGGMLNSPKIISESIKLTPDGIQTTVSSLSPFALGYKLPSSAPSAPAPQVPSTPSVPKTGDSANLALWTAMCVLGLMGTVILHKRQKA